MNSINWSLNIHFYSDASGFTDELVITQFQKISEESKSIEIPIIYNTLTFSVTEQKYQTYKQKLCIIVKFAIKVQYLLQNSECSEIIHTDYKLLIYFLNFSLHNNIYRH